MLIERDNPRLLPPDLLSRVQNIVAALILSEDLDGFIADAPRGWRIHQLAGQREGEWSVSVSGNWRLTFREEGGYIDRLNLEDYH